MTRLIVILLAVITPCVCLAQDRKDAVYVGHEGRDQVGTLFASAFNRDLTRSARYKLMPAGTTSEGFRFDVDLMSVDAADALQNQGKKSVVSVVIEEMGLPNSFPVSHMWYHKIIVVTRQDVDKLSKELLDDMTARWCRYTKNSANGCPQEKIGPKP